MIFNSASDIDALGYDCVLEVKESDTRTVTYLGRFDEKKLDPNFEGNLIDQPIWQIKRVVEEKVSNVTQITFEFPLGSDGYCFPMSEAMYMTYCNRHTRFSIGDFRSEPM